MFYWIIVFLVVSLISGIVGFSGLSAAPVEVSRTVFFIALALFVITLSINMFKNRKR